MLRILGIVAVVAIVASAVFASAAGLNLTGGYIQAGVDDDLTCTEGAWISNYGLERDSNTVGTIKVDGLADCVAGKLMIDILDEDGEILPGGRFSFAGTAPMDGTKVVLTMSPAPAPEDIGGIRVWTHSALNAMPTP